MKEIAKEYSVLFNGISDTIVELEKLAEGLRQLQCVAEEAFLDGREAENNTRQFKARVSEPNGIRAAD